jgi:hypothetical protein
LRMWGLRRRRRRRMWGPCEEGICTVLCELQGICTVACEWDLHVGAPLMPIRHLLHCNLCPSACPSFITSSLGGCETWVPLGPHRPGSRPSPTSRSGLPEDPSTCQWAHLI